jgi:hypothetical protein
METEELAIEPSVFAWLLEKVIVLLLCCYCVADVLLMCC